jgi:MFS family permease
MVGSVERLTFGAWWMVGILLVFNVLSMLDRQILTLLVIPIQQDLGLTDFGMSLIIGPAFAVSGALAILPFGWASDRFSRRWVIFGGVVFWSVACVASGLTRSFTGLFAARAGVAIGEAALGPPSYSLIADRFPRRRLTTALALYSLGPKLGVSAAFALGAAAMALSEHAGSLHFPLIGELTSWRLALFLIGAPGILLAFLTFTFSEPSKVASKAKGVHDATLRSFIKQHKGMLIQLMLGFGFMSICSGAINSWAPTFVTRQFGWTAVQYGPAMSLIGLIGAAAIVPKGMIVDWLYTRGVHDAHVRFFTWLQMAGVPLIVVAFMLTNVAPFLIIYGVINILTLSFSLYLSSVIQIISPANIRGQLTAAFLLFIGVVVQGIAPPLVAGVTDFFFADQSRVGHSIVLVAGSSLALSCVCLRISLIRLRPYITQKEQPEAAGPAAEPAPERTGPLASAQAGGLPRG